MFGKFLERLARLWSVNDESPPNVDLIVLVSFGATKDGLTRGAQATLERAVALARQYPEARVAFGVFTLSPRSGLEWSLKRRLFRDPICAGEVVSTIEEAEKIRASLPYGFTPQNIVIVTDQWHSRSAKTVWRRIWRDAIPRPDVRVSTVLSSAVIDEESPMTNLRKHWSWARTNILRQAVLICVPGSIRLMKKLKLRQPTG